MHVNHHSVNDMLIMFEELFKDQRVSVNIKLKKFTPSSKVKQMTGDIHNTQEGNNRTVIMNYCTLPTQLWQFMHF